MAQDSVGVEDLCHGGLQSVYPPHLQRKQHVSLFKLLFRDTKVNCLICEQPNLSERERARELEMCGSFGGFFFYSCDLPFSCSLALLQVCAGKQLRRTGLKKQYDTYANQIKCTS